MDTNTSEPANAVGVSGMLTDNAIDSTEAQKGRGLNTAIQMVADKEAEPAIRAALVDIGIPEADMPAIITNARKLVFDAKRKHALKGMGIGALWLVGGLIITAAGYLMAGEGQSYFVTWGAVAFGGFRVVVNLFAYLGAKA